MGLGLTLVVSAVLARIMGPAAGAAGAGAGVVATLIQWLAMRRLHAHLGGSNSQFFTAVGFGMALRLAGVGVVAVATIADPRRFPPVPTAAGFLAVLIPLLFLEVYRLR